MDIHGPRLFSISPNHLPTSDGEDDESLMEEVIMMVVNDKADGYS